MPTKKAPTRGGNRRPVEFVKDPENGQPVPGLRLHKPTDRYYRIEDDRRIYYKPKGLKGVAYLRRAVFEHRCWQDGRDLNQAESLIVNTVAYDRYGAELRYTASVSDDGLLTTEVLLNPEDLAGYVREQLQNPETRFDFADRVGIPELARLDRLRPSELSLPLQQLGDLFFVQRKKQVTEKTRRDGLKYWREFCELMGANLVSEITGQHIRNYHDTIYDRFNNGKSAAYVKARFATVKTVFNYALKRQQDVDNVQQVLLYCKMFEPPEASRMGPQPISPEHFRKLLAVADTKWQAMLLIGLNAAYYPIDICRLLKTDIKPEKHGLAEDRTKTGVPRVAWLWDRTLDAVAAYQKAEPHEHETLFVSVAGEPYRRANPLARFFWKLRKKAGVPETVQFAHLRDGAASHSGPDVKQAQMLLGHRIGEIDKYKLREPSKVKDACEALEAHYFPD